jgi:hypothetical protein
MSDEIPEDANIYFCALKKSGYVLRDGVVIAADAAICAAIGLIVGMCSAMVVYLISKYLSRSIISLLSFIPVPVYIILIALAVVYGWSLVWCHDRKTVAKMKKVCVKYGIDPNVFESFDDINKLRVYIHFDKKYIDIFPKFEDFSEVCKGEECAIASLSMYNFVEKVKYFEQNNIPIVVVVNTPLSFQGWD